MERRLYSFLFSLVVFILLPPLIPSYNEEETIKFGLVHSWAEKLGAELWHFGDYITRRKEVQDSFDTAQVEDRDGKKIVEQMASDISNMMELKISAVKRIMDAAENMAVTLQLQDPKATVPPDFKFYNSKRIEPPGTPTTPSYAPTGDDDSPTPSPIREVVLTPNPHFNNIPVNTSFSSVHVPTNVYDRADEVIDAIRWSENLDSIFTSNYRADPSLSWQYFGSSTGFMRHYPAMQWKASPVDLFDCRTRSWYIEAAVSPKDVIVLVDNSGSMTGQRREIARHVVSNILDTLGNNDFVNIFTFNDTVQEVEPCFADMLVQATLANVRELKLGLEGIDTTGIANFSAALTHAFELLEVYRESREGARCNQAIMLVSDGVPYNYKEIFEIYNWRQRPKMPVRVFTYLIGREVADVREVKWMACANQGYYVHLSTLAEVREQVLNYIPVMARPLVLWGDQHPIIWTPVYADITDPKMTDWLWEKRESEEQRERVMSVKRNITKFMSMEEKDRRYARKQKEMEEQEAGDFQAYKLMTSVSMPVFDKRENANITENVLVNEAYWVTITRETRVANLLGVAGTDVPIEDIQALMMPHQLGVNGYAFIVTNNGFILTHPDLRPVFQGILKPNYNSVDMLEVELMDDQRGPRDFDPELVEVRNEVISQSSGSKWMQVKYHFDNMKRVSRIRRQYFWTGIPRSPFSLVVALPEPYGLHRLSLRPEDDIHRSRLKGNNATHYFQGRRWRIHPEWLYCRHHEKTFPTPEDELRYFLDRMRQQGWHWPLKPRPPEHMHSNTTVKSEPKTEKDSYFCDRSLMQAVVFDARVTDWFSQNITGFKDDKGKEFIQRFGITVAFVATHSGLTRWLSFPQPDDPHNSSKRPEFGELYPRATDEVWYKRAVEQHYMEPSMESFVYSVDFDAGERYRSMGSDTPIDMPLVIATHAVFHTVESKSAPAAVVGFQFHHSSLHALFTNITSSCGESVTCMKTCKSEELDCYVIDNNGFVVVSENLHDAGRFFGEVRPPVMKQLVGEKVFREVSITDYQAVCADTIEITNPASTLLTPFRYMRQLFGCLVSYMFWVWQHSSFLSSEAYGDSYANEEVMYQNYEIDTEPTNGGEGGLKRTFRLQDSHVDKAITINRTRPAPCDKKVSLYQLQQYPDKERAPYRNPAKGCERAYVVQVIPGSNLVLVVVDSVCPQDELAPPLRLAPMPVERNHSLACERASMAPLHRQKLQPCINFHPNESQIELCGGGSHTTIAWKFPFLLSCFIISLNHFRQRPARS